MSRRLEDREILVIITTSGERHCSNDCRFINTMGNGRAQCVLFGELTWDKRRKLDGFRRPADCRNSEPEKTHA